MLRLFGDVPEVMRSTNKRTQDLFCRMPLHAVHAWAECDELRVHSENCVACLLDAWSHANPHVDVPPSLVKCVRVDQLTPAFLTILSESPSSLFKPLSSGGERRPRLEDYIKWVTFAATNKTKIRRKPENFDLPDSWFAPPRAHTVETTDDVLDWAVPLQHLRVVLVSPFTLGSVSVYVNGVYFWLEFIKRHEPLTISLVLRVGLFRNTTNQACPVCLVSARLQMLAQSPTESSKELVVCDLQSPSKGGSSLALVEPGAVGENPSAEQLKQLLGPWLDSKDTLHLRASDLRFA